MGGLNIQRNPITIIFVLSTITYMMHQLKMPKISKRPKNILYVANTSTPIMAGLQCKQNKQKSCSLSI